MREHSPQLFNVHASSSQQLRHRPGEGLRELLERLDPGLFF